MCIDVAIPVVGNLIRTSASHLHPNNQQLLRRQYRALANNVKNTLESKDAYTAELQAELLSTKGSCPKSRPMKRFPYGYDPTITPINRRRHGYQEGWSLSGRTDYSEGMAARLIRTRALSAGRCGELSTEMRQVYEQIYVCQWDK